MVISYTTVAALLESNAERQKQHYALISTRNPLKLFELRRVERVDQNAKRFKRAVNFKVYLTNPSMRAALFGQISADSDAMGSLTETAIYSQWQHSALTELYYARWNTGEVDLVSLTASTQQPNWAVEIKWSDRPYQARSELDGCADFATRNPRMQQPVLICRCFVHVVRCGYR